MTTLSFSWERMHPKTEHLERWVQFGAEGLPAGNEEHLPDRQRFAEKISSQPEEHVETLK